MLVYLRAIFTNVVILLFAFENILIKKKKKNLSSCDFLSILSTSYRDLSFSYNSPIITTNDPWLDVESLRVISLVGGKNEFSPDKMKKKRATCPLLFVSREDRYYRHNVSLFFQRRSMSINRVVSDKVLAGKRSCLWSWRSNYRCQKLAKKIKERK